MNAVNSEHKKNLQSDSWRIHQLEKSLTSPNHPFCKFGTGSIETLRDIPKEKGINIRKVLLDFHSKYYSANLMRLCIVGKESLEELQDFALSMFSDIENKSVPVPKFEGHPLTEKELGVSPLKKTTHARTHTYIHTYTHIRKFIDTSRVTHL